MKVKDFKTQLKNEHLDIPNVLDNIKNIAYSAEYLNAHFLVAF